MPLTQSATVQTKQRDATSACQRALLLLQQVPEAETLGQVAEALSDAQSALAVMAHCLEQSQTPPVVATEAEIESAIPMPSEPQEMEENDAPYAEVSTPTTESVQLEAPEWQPEAHNTPAAGPSLAQKLSESRLESIQQALSINDRVRFAAELAHGDMARFQTICQTVDGSSDEEAAIRAVESTCSQISDWSDEEAAPYQFLQLVRRVFA